MQIKAPAAVLDWPITYALETGETITGSTWTVSPVETGGITTSSPTISGATVACLVSAGVFRHVYELTNTITTNAGRTHSQVVAFRIGNVEAI